MVRCLFLLWVAVCVSSFAVDSRGGLVENPAAINQSLIVGVSHGLPGLKYDMQHVEAMATNPNYKFQVSTLYEGKGTKGGIAAELTRLSAATGMEGTLFFYFTGHGNVGNVQAQDGLMSIGAVRSAIEAGRGQFGPLARLVLIFDTCHSGSLLDPVRRIFMSDEIASSHFADEVKREFESGSRLNYWQNLFVFASSRANETSLAGSKGSVFTLAMKKAFDETISSGATIGEFIEKSQKYTKGHHPVARVVPEELKNESMVTLD